MAIKFNNVNYSITDNATYIKNVLSNIEMCIDDKSITAIMGKSGSGKSSILSMIDGLVLPSQGDIRISNKKVTETPNNIAIVFQNPDEQFFLETVFKEISFGIKHINKKVKDVEKHVIDALKMVGLDESYLNRNPFTLSCGEKRKVAIASALSVNPKILLLDEPTIGLDNESIENMIKLIRMLKNKYNKTIIITSKDSDFVHKIADKVVILYNGKIVLSGNKYDVFKDDILKYGIKRPKIMEFEKLVRETKNVRLLYRDEINDLMKDIYRNVSR